MEIRYIRPRRLIPHPTMSVRREEKEKRKEYAQSQQDPEKLEESASSERRRGVEYQ